MDQPVPLFFIQLRPDLPPHLLLVSVEAGHILVRHDRQVQGLRVQRGKRQRLKAVKAFKFRMPYAEQQVLRADTVAALDVNPRLVAGNHARFKGDVSSGIGVRAGPHCRRPLMDIQKAADAVAGAVIEIDAPCPEGLPCEGIQVHAAGPPREHRVHEIQHAHHRQRIVPPLFLCGPAEGDGPGHIGGAVLVLGAGIHKIESLRQDLCRRLFHREIVGKGGIRAPGGDGRKAQGQKFRIRCPQAVQHGRRVRLGEAAGLFPVIRRCDRGLQPVQEFREPHPVPEMAVPHAFLLGFIFNAFQECRRADRVLHRVPPADPQPAVIVHCGHIHQHGLAGKRGQCRREAVIVADLDPRLLHGGKGFVRQGLLPDIQPAGAVCQDQIRQKNRVAADVAAPEIRDPGGLIQRSGHINRGTCLFHLHPEILKLVLCAPARILFRDCPHRFAAYRRTVLPDLVHRIPVRLDGPALSDDGPCKAAAQAGAHKPAGKTKLHAF